MHNLRRLVTVALTVAVGFGLANTSNARADDGDVPWPFVGYHWCPGNPFSADWGPQWDPTTCHDAHHRDMDGTMHNRDYFGPSPFQDWPEIPNNRP
ncbi:hypothetical protein ACX9NE_19930 [Mycobacterium sp. ML4]